MINVLLFFADLALTVLGGYLLGRRDGARKGYTQGLAAGRTLPRREVR